MKNNKVLFIGIATAVVVLIAGVVLLAGNSNKNSSTADTGDSMNMDAKPEASNSEAGSAANTSKAVEASNVTIQDYKFVEPLIKVKVGTTVTWINKDGVRHNVAPDGDSDLPEGKQIGNNETYSYTFNKAGTFDYLCTPHPYMKGTVVVTE